MSKIDLPSRRKKTSARKKVTSRKRRQNQNDQIDELASLVPLATPPSSSLSPPGTSLVPSYGSLSTTSCMDKLTVLRLTTSFLRLKGFMKDTTPTGDGENTSTNFIGLMEEAIGGFMIVLDGEANILYVSETVAHHVGLNHVELIGQNLVDVTHPDSAVEIRDNLKPSVISSVTLADDCSYIISQFRQFCVRLRHTASHLRVLPHTMIQVIGNLKVKLPPLKTSDGTKKIVALEPSVIGFVGECHVVKSARLLFDLSLPHSTFTSTVTLNFKPLSVEATVKEIVGYEPEELLNDELDDDDFVHPADLGCLVPSKQFLIETGHALTPHFRFLAKSGDWVWMQVEGTVHCRRGTSNPQFYEYKARVLSQGGGRLKYIEQKEIYATKSTPDSSLVKYRKISGTESVSESLKRSRLPNSLLEPVMYGRSKMMNKHSELIDLLLETNKSNESAVQNPKTVDESRPSVSPISVISPASDSSLYTSTTQSSCTDDDGRLDSAKCARDIETMSLSSSPNSLTNAISPSQTGSLTAVHTDTTSYNVDDDLFQATANGSHDNLIPSQVEFIRTSETMGSNSAGLTGFSASSMAHSLSLTDHNLLGVTNAAMCGSGMTIDDSSWSAFGLTSAVGTESNTTPFPLLSHEMQTAPQSNDYVPSMTSHQFQISHFLPQASTITSNFDHQGLDACNGSTSHPYRLDLHESMFDSSNAITCANPDDLVTHQLLNELPSTLGVSSTGLGFAGTSLSECSSVEHNPSVSLQSDFLPPNSNVPQVHGFVCDSVDVQDILQQFL